MTSENTNKVKTDLKACTDLVIVCCHAVYTGDGKNTAESQWLLQHFQQSNPAAGKPSEHETLITHILAGVLAIDHNPRALLIFSGGRTRDVDRTEARGYEKIFLQQRRKERNEDCSRYALEENATDSYQNLLFSILRFRELVGQYPEAVTVISHAFKERRFLELHAPAIKWPARRIRVQGVNPPFTAKELEETRRGELERAQRLFEDSPYGNSEMLAEKRRVRNWSAASLIGVGRGLEPSVKDLLAWKGGGDGREIFPGRLPWEER